ncbi:MAG TPA: DUF1116 domain-containing protein, partial [Aggregatilineaceae bacterium]|nr:DUF1116 domain-containing protein [Aggregatilineaceae bacterium]
MSNNIKDKIEAANAEAAKRMIDGNPVLVDIAPAGEVIPGMTNRMILHSGPPVDWAHMSGAQRGSAMGAAIFEGWARNPEEAAELLGSGRITFEPNHHHQAVGPMAGTITASMPVFVVQNPTFGNRAFCRQVESMQQFGDYSEKALDGLRFWRDIAAPSIRIGLKQIGGLPLKSILAKALQMGDELHNRAVSASSLFANQMAVAMVEADVPKQSLVPTLKLLTNHELFFLGLSMASGKSIADSARNVEY